MAFNLWIALCLQKTFPFPDFLIISLFSFFLFFLLVSYNIYPFILSGFPVNLFGSN